MKKIRVRFIVLGGRGIVSRIVTVPDDVHLHAVADACENEVKRLWGDYIE